MIMRYFAVYNIPPFYIVVKLFNAIRNAQKKVEKIKSKPEGKSVSGTACSLQSSFWHEKLNQDILT